MVVPSSFRLLPAMVLAALLALGACTQTDPPPTTGDPDPEPTIEDEQTGEDPLPSLSQLVAARTDLTAFAMLAAAVDLDLDTLVTTDDVTVFLPDDDSFAIVVADRGFGDVEALADHLAVASASNREAFALYLAAHVGRGLPPALAPTLLDVIAPSGADWRYVDAQRDIDADTLREFDYRIQTGVRFLIASGRAGESEWRADYTIVDVRARAVPFERGVVHVIYGEPE